MLAILRNQNRKIKECIQTRKTSKHQWTEFFAQLFQSDEQNGQGTAEELEHSVKVDIAVKYVEETLQ